MVRSGGGGVTSSNTKILLGKITKICHFCWQIALTFCTLEEELGVEEKQSIHELVKSTESHNVPMN